MEAKNPSDAITCEVWKAFIAEEKTKPYFKELGNKLKEAAKTNTVYPSYSDRLNAFIYTPYNKVKICVLGQDPYHTGYADGLAFSSKESTFPPSLKNILAEIKTDDFEAAIINDKDLFQTSSLKQWALQGVFLFNTVLTVNKGVAASHKKFGWENLSVACIQRLNERIEPVVFMLWGNDAKSYKKYITQSHHLVLEAAHPQSENYKQNAGFYGCRHFTKANEFIKNKIGVTDQQRLPINWGLFKNYNY